jgi:hypothetical protein
MKLMNQIQRKSRLAQCAGYRLFRNEFALTAQSSPRVVEIIGDARFNVTPPSHGKFSRFILASVWNREKSTFEFDFNSAILGSPLVHQFHNLFNVLRSEDWRTRFQHVPSRILRNLVYSIWLNSSDTFRHNPKVGAIIYRSRCRFGNRIRRRRDGGCRTAWIWPARINCLRNFFGRFFGAGNTQWQHDSGDKKLIKLIHLHFSPSRRLVRILSNEVSGGGQ